MTEAGRRQLEEWRREVLGRAEEAARLRREGREHEAQSLIDQLLPALPVLVALGVLSLALWKLLATYLWAKKSRPRHAGGDRSKQRLRR